MNRFVISIVDVCRKTERLKFCIFYLFINYSAITVSQCDTAKKV